MTKETQRRRTLDATTPARRTLSSDKPTPAAKKAAATATPKGPTVEELEAAAALKKDEDAAAAEATSRAEAEAAAEQVQSEATPAGHVKVVVPKSYRLTIDHHRHVDYPAGTTSMPRAHAEHWWSKNYGVTIAE